MDDFISKPVNPQTLIELINKSKSESLGSKSFQAPDSDILSDRDIIDVETQQQVFVDFEDNDAVVPVFDGTKFLERFGNDQDLAGEVLGAFLQEVHLLVDNLVAAIKKEPFDPEGVRACAHALKGGAANVNAEQLRRAAFNIETRAGDGVPSDPLAVPELLKQHLNRFNGKAHL
jgi:HPt (histidine-containing phosphotransfer) domain-containing protein